MESGTNPQNISIFQDWYDDNNRPYINYSCYEGYTNSCGDGGDVHFANESGGHLDDTYRLWDIENDTDVDSVFVHLYDAFFNLSLITHPSPMLGILATAIDLKFLFFIFLMVLYKLFAASFKLPFLLKLN